MKRTALAALLIVLPCLFPGEIRAQYVPLQAWDEASVRWNVLRWGYDSMMEDHIRRVAFELNLGRHWPDDPEDIRRRQEEVRNKLRETFGLHLLQKVPLNARITGKVDRGDYTIEKLVYTSLPGVYVTANVYVPKDGGKKHPAVLCPHGHWPHGRFQPEIQARCIGLAKLGYVVLTLDKYGYGERRFTGHHDAFFLLPTGLTLEGLQIWDNMRGIDYLISRPDVDATRIGITGASGGGNQTMYTAALDTRIASAVPTVSVNTFDGLFFRGIGCVCEGTPNILRFADEWDVLACIAPRPLYIPSNLLDSIFPVARAREAYLRAKRVYESLGAGENIAIRHFYDRHSYNQELREMMYGWFEHVFRGKPFEPIPEPAGTQPTLDFDELRALPERGFPPDAKTLQALATEAAHRYDHPKTFASLQEWKEYRRDVLAFLRQEVFGDFPSPQSAPLRVTVVDTISYGNWWLEKWIFWSDWDVLIPAVCLRRPHARGTIILAHRAGKDRAAIENWLEQAYHTGLNVVAIDLRGIGETREETRLLVQNGNVVGKPALGEWAWDLIRTADAVKQRLGEPAAQKLYVIGNGPAGLAALFACLYDPRFDGVAAVSTLATYVADEEGYHVEWVYYLHRILQKADIPQLTALCAPVRLVLAGAVKPSTEKLEAGEFATLFEPAKAAYKLQGVPGNLVFTGETGIRAVLEELFR